MRGCAKGVALFAGVVVAGLVLSLALAGRFLSAPAQVPDKADLIVALGGDGGSRVLKAARLYREGWAQRIMLTGIEGGDAAARDAFLEWRALLLNEHGVPRSALLFERSAGNSREEAAAVRVWMAHEGWRRVIVVSDPPHLRRLQRIWSRTFQDTDIEFRLVASDMPGWAADRWWAHERSAQFVLTEAVKIVYDSIIASREWIQ
jgi:uncharacterized SAM-binding protein YcdF (DUF218 family)